MPIVCPHCEREIDVPEIISVDEVVKDYYTIPRWCNMSLGYHFDGIGGCWSIGNGSVLKGGKKFCQDCEFIRKVVK